MKTGELASASDMRQIVLVPSLISLLVMPTTAYASTGNFITPETVFFLCTACLPILFSLAFPLYKGFSASSCNWNSLALCLVCSFALNGVVLCIGLYAVWFASLAVSRQLAWLLILFFSGAAIVCTVWIARVLVKLAPWIAAR